MQRQRQQHTAHIGTQAFEQIDALLGKHLAHQEEHAIGCQLHNELYQLHHHHIQIFKNGTDAPPVLPGVIQRNPHQNGEHDHLQHVAFGHGLHRVVGEDIDQHLHERRPLFHCIGFEIRTEVGPCAGIEDLGHHQGQGDGHPGGQQIQNEGFAAQPPQAFAFFGRNHTTDQGDQHQGYNHQFEQVDKDFAKHQKHAIDQIFLHPGSEHRIGKGNTAVIHHQSRPKAQHQTRKYAHGQCIFRMAGLVGPRLRRICHPDSSFYPLTGVADINIE